MKNNKGEQKNVAKEVQKEQKKPKKLSVVEQLTQKNEELTKTAQYLQAEFQNYKSRVERDRNDHAQFANKDLILSILPVIDNFELAIKSANDHKETKCVDEEFLKGTELIYAQLLDVLKKEGLEQIKTRDQKFDPYKHECLMQEDSDKESGSITEEFQKGYFLKDKVVRHSKVKVAK